MNHFQGSIGGPTLLLAHGAGAGAGHPWMLDVASTLSASGVTVVTFEFPYMRAGRRRPDPAPVLEAAFAEAWRELQERWPPLGLVFAGGKSMGGRIATQATAAGLLIPEPAGLVCFGYPLHPPAKPSVRRDAHLPAIRCPVLFVHGTKDGFGTPAEMNELQARLPTSTLIFAHEGDHSLDAPKRVDRDGLTRRAAVEAAANWMRSL